MQTVSRRDFLKAAGTVVASAAVPHTVANAAGAGTAKPNFIILVFDTLSALHLSLHGYERLTTPNLDAFAARSTVFHANYSPGNFTTPGTASMLSGMYPWKHRAMNPGGLMRQEYVRASPFSQLRSGYRRFGFSQNIWADRLLQQHGVDLDRHLLPESYSLRRADSGNSIRSLDPVIGSIAVDEFLLPIQGEAPAGSALIAYLHKTYVLRRTAKANSGRYPKGTPEITNPGFWIPFLNESVFEGVYSELAALEREPSPYFAYIHFWSPHSPYRPSAEYRDWFRDTFVPPPKPALHFPAGLSEDYLLSQRTLYDRQIAQLDEEFGRLVSRLEGLGALERAYVIITSDHGELFERGFVGHGFERLYEAVIRVPLIIHAPGQHRRQDVLEPTSNIDLLPTLLTLCPRPVPSEIEGRVLPGLGGEGAPDRPIFSMYAATNSAFAPIERTSIAMRKGAYKLIAYLGFAGLDKVFELYDLEQDPEELRDLASSDPVHLAQMRTEFDEHLNLANRTFADQQ